FAQLTRRAESPKIRLRGHCACVSAAHLGGRAQLATKAPAQASECTRRDAVRPGIFSSPGPYIPYRFGSVCIATRLDGDEQDERTRSQSETGPQGSAARGGS